MSIIRAALPVKRTKNSPNTASTADPRGTGQPACVINRVAAHVTSPTRRVSVSRIVDPLATASLGTNGSATTTAAIVAGATPLATRSSQLVVRKGDAGRAIGCDTGDVADGEADGDADAEPRRRLTVFSPQWRNVREIFGERTIQGSR